MTALAKLIDLWTAGHPRSCQCHLCIPLRLEAFADGDWELCYGCSPQKKSYPNSLIALGAASILGQTFTTLGPENETLDEAFLLAPASAPVEPVSVKKTKPASRRKGAKRT